jgi:hypothetical protein
MVLVSDMFLLSSQLTRGARMCCRSPASCSDDTFPPFFPIVKYPSNAFHHQLWGASRCQLCLLVQTVVRLASRVRRAIIQYLTHSRFYNTVLNCTTDTSMAVTWTQHP